MKNLLNKSTEERALSLIIENGLNPLEAVKQALKEEIELVNDMFNPIGNGLSEKGNDVCERMMNRFYIANH